ncbi:hypothetical protein Tco_1218150 [Tanacetum coccineum]
MQVVQVILWYLDSGCSKHMTGNRSKLKNFVEKFIGTVRFGNDHFGAIMGYGDYVIGDSVISRVYYVERTWTQSFSIRQFVILILTLPSKSNHVHIFVNKNGADLLKAEDLRQFQAKADLGFRWENQFCTDNTEDDSLTKPNQLLNTDHLRRWTKVSPSDNIVGIPTRPVSTKKTVSIRCFGCCYHTELFQSLNPKKLQNGH